MRKILILCIVLGSFALSNFFVPQVHADTDPSISIKIKDPVIRGEGDIIAVIEKSSGTFSDGKTYVAIRKGPGGTNVVLGHISSGTRQDFTIPNGGRDILQNGTNTVELYGAQGYTVDTHNTNNIVAKKDFTVIQGGDPALGTIGTKFTRGTKFDLYIINPKSGVDYAIWYDKAGRFGVLPGGGKLNANAPWNGVENAAAKISVNTDDLASSNPIKKLCLAEAQAVLGLDAGLPCTWSHYIEITETDVQEPEVPVQGNVTGDQGPVSSGQSSGQTPTPPAPPCADGKAGDQIGTSGCQSVSTAVGTLSTKPENFIITLFTILLGLSGGIAVLIFIAAGYKYMTSQGNPEAVKGAQEMIVSAIAGLLFIIFSFVILQIIGVDILRIPGFS